MESKKAGPGLKDREAELLLKSVPDGSVLVALDERGRIRQVETRESGPLSADLYIDCSGFAGLLAWDERETKIGHVPAWYPYLRRPLTALVTLSLMTGALASLI